MKKAFFLLSLLAAIGQLQPVRAQIIDFETLPNGIIPAQGMVISNQFWNSYGVTFRFEDGKYPVIAKTNAPLMAFWGPPNSTKRDLPATNQNLGVFFLTDGGGVNAVPAPLIIDYREPVAAASGEIIDIDSNADAWTIEALNQQTQVVASVTLTRTSPNAGDGKAAPWSITRPAADIHALRIFYVGSEVSIGWAFDNFAPSLPSAPAQLTATLLPQALQLSIGGTFGKGYRVEYKDGLTSATWHTLTNMFLTNAPTQYVTDTTVTNASARFYRAVGLP